MSASQLVYERKVLFYVDCFLFGLENTSSRKLENRFLKQYAACSIVSTNRVSRSKEPNPLTISEVNLVSPAAVPKRCATYPRACLPKSSRLLAIISSRLSSLFFASLRSFSDLRLQQASSRGPSFKRDKKSLTVGGFCIWNGDSKYVMVISFGRQATGSNAPLGKFVQILAELLVYMKPSISSRLEIEDEAAGI